MRRGNVKVLMDKRKSQGITQSYGDFKCWSAVSVGSSPIERRDGGLHPLVGLHEYQGKQGLVYIASLGMHPVVRYNPRKVTRRLDRQTGYHHGTDKVRSLVERIMREDN